ncbi:hypothetical protein HAX54_005107 [Datura stramonium]|uniref:Uncharacterized protein n=1 Tax=Datura stramonium TaxID=4076 RepID=A0ABS8T9B5_DATST|nr:hypothetical protein [Datura stramonium]
MWEKQKSENSEPSWIRTDLPETQKRKAGIVEGRSSKLRHQPKLVQSTPSLYGWEKTTMVLGQGCWVRLVSGVEGAGSLVMLLMVKGVKIQGVKGRSGPGQKGFLDRD